MVGGGAALVHVAIGLDDLGQTGDAATGVSVVKKALSEPARWIALNAGQEGSVVVAKIAGLPATATGTRTSLGALPANAGPRCPWPRVRCSMAHCSMAHCSRSHCCGARSPGVGGRSRV